MHKKGDEKSDRHEEDEFIERELPPETPILFEPQERKVDPGTRPTEKDRAVGRNRRRALLGELRAVGLPSRYLERAIPWEWVHANPKLSSTAVVSRLLQQRIWADIGRRRGDPFADIEDDIRHDDAHDAAFGSDKGIRYGPTSELSLEWCKMKYVCEVPEGEHVTIEISNNATLPFDTSGTVTFWRRRPNAPNGRRRFRKLGERVGNKSIDFVGRMVIWAHLEGGTADNPDEEACDLKVRPWKFRE